MNETAEATMGQTHRPNKTHRNLRTLRPYILALTAALFFTTTSTALAESEFQGALKSVSITDAAATNGPPTALFTYIQEGDVFTFDASGSSDSDGSITEYKWDFGDGTTAVGQNPSVTITNDSPLRVTLTVIDNNNGIALFQETVGGVACSGDYGLTGTGTYAPVSTAKRIFLTKVDSCAGDIASVTARLNEIKIDSREVIYVIYEDDGGEPGNLIWNSGAFYDAAIGSTTAWKTETISGGQTVTGTSLWVGMFFEFDSSGYERTSGGTGRLYLARGFSTGDVPDPWPVDSDTDFPFDLSMYVTY